MTGAEVLLFNDSSKVALDSISVIINNSQVPVPWWEGAAGVAVAAALIASFTSLCVSMLSQRFQRRTIEIQIEESSRNLQRQLDSQVSVAHEQIQASWNNLQSQLANQRSESVQHLRAELLWKQKFEELKQLQEFIGEYLALIGWAIDNQQIDGKRIIELAAKINWMILTHDAAGIALVNDISNAMKMILDKKGTIPEGSISANLHTSDKGLARYYTSIQQQANEYIQLRRTSLLNEAIAKFS